MCFPSSAVVMVDMIVGGLEIGDHNKRGRTLLPAYYYVSGLSEDEYDRSQAPQAVE